MLLAAVVGFAAAARASMLPNGWTVTPAGALTPLGTLPLHVALDRTGRWLAVTNAGYGAQSLRIVDASTGRIVTSAPIAATFYGIAFSPDDRLLYVSSADAGGVRRFRFDPRRGALKDLGGWRLAPGDPWIAGIALSRNGEALYAVANLRDSLIAADTRSHVVLWSAHTGKSPYATVLSADGTLLFVSDWAGSAVSVVSAKNGKPVASIGVPAHPNAMVLSPDGATLYVACANTSSVAAIDARSLRLSRVLHAGLWPHALEGTTPNGLALSPDAKTLFVADADDNAVAAIDVSATGGPLRGAIPVGWYPTDVAISLDGKRLFVLDGKGTRDHANPAFQHTAVTNFTDDRLYVANLATGDLERIVTPDAAALRSGLQQSRENALYGRRTRSAGAALPVRSAANAVHHVIYIIKENRTYDEVLGDDPRGNGDARLAIFGKRVTPNIHRLADDFVLLDNFYEDAEVSADGHNWTDAAYATDYVQKLWPDNYSGRKRDYDFEGTPQSRPSAGYIWDRAIASGLSVRDYGEQTVFGAATSIPMDLELRGRMDARYRGWDLKYSDQRRVDEWQREFRQFVHSGTMPALEVVYLPDDHTGGTHTEYRTPYAMLAGNDYAVGRVIDTLSHSRYWRDTVVFVVEDDAQAGPDHVSDQRGEALVAGAAVRRRFVDHTHYTQSSVLATIERLLHLAPLSQFDAGATTMERVFSDAPDVRPWSVSPPNYDLGAMNGRKAAAVRLSTALDLSKPDGSDPALLNRILWEYAHTR